MGDEGANEVDGSGIAVAGKRGIGDGGYGGGRGRHPSMREGLREEARRRSKGGTGRMGAAPVQEGAIEGARETGERGDGADGGGTRP